MMAFKDITLMPPDLRRFFGPYGPQFFDGSCGEPIAWGHAVLARMDEENWKIAAEYGQLECDHGSGNWPLKFNWFLISKRLTPEEARKQYGEVNAVETGPRGGFRSVTYGTKRFISRRLDPRSKD
jgi:hypothetical protein